MRKEKQANARGRLLRYLMENPTGVTNVQLISLFPSFRARMSELYEEGYIIEKTRLSDGVNLYRYKGFKRKELDDANTLVNRALQQKGLGNLMDTFNQVLEEAGVVLHRKTLKS